MNLFKQSQVFTVLWLVAINSSQQAGAYQFPKQKGDKAIAQRTASSEKEKKEMSVYDFKAKTLDGKDLSFDKYKGDVLLIVNTASECGFTPQYAGLEELDKKYAARGLKVLAFPCNQFGAQEPGDSKTIAGFCHSKYGVTFQVFDKIDVNGKDAHPIYAFLKSSAPESSADDAIAWNFTKFLVDRKGNVIKRYAPNVKPEEIDSDIQKQLAPL